MVFVDVHAHLTMDVMMKKLDKVLERSSEANVKIIVANGTDVDSNRKVLELSNKYNIIKPALGFYPTHTTEVSEEELDQELKFIEEQKPIAIGEVGLDYKFGDIPEEEKEKRTKIQKKSFQKIIKLAEKLNIPIIIHSRKAELDVIEMLEASNLKKIIMHCFSGKKKLVDRIIANSWSISIPVTVIKLQQFQEMVSKAKLSQLLTETDAPYLGPEPGLDNEPHNVVLTIKKIAEIKGLNEKEIEDQIYLNYTRVFE